MPNLRQDLPATITVAPGMQCPAQLARAVRNRLASIHASIDALELRVGAAALKPATWTGQAELAAIDDALQGLLGTEEV